MPDSKWQASHPCFFKCSQCGHVFKFVAPVASKTFLPPVDFTPEHVTPLAEIFSESAGESDIKTDTESDQATNYPKPVSQPHLFEDSGLSEELEKADADEVPQIDSFEPVSSSAVFEPVKPKMTVVSRFVIGICASIIAFFAVFCVFYIAHLFIHDDPVYVMPIRKAKKKLFFQNTNFQLSGTRDLSVSSELVNGTDHEMQIPNVVVMLKNKNGLELQRAYVFLKQEKIQPQEVVPISVMMNDVAQDASEIEIKTEVAQ